MRKYYLANKKKLFRVYKVVWKLGIPRRNICFNIYKKS